MGSGLADSAALRKGEESDVTLAAMTAAKTPTMDGFRVAPDISAEIARWLSHLGAERRMSVKTLDAYQRDVSQFLGFLTDHLGSAPTLKQLAKLTPADIRAFMA
ncbi:MAG TPA: site-specific integrase, partial [Pseudolabrys sp.]